jgi:hypothetical protein
MIPFQSSSLQLGITSSFVGAAPAISTMVFKWVLLSSYKHYLPDYIKFKPANHEATSPILSPFPVD